MGVVDGKRAEDMEDRNYDWKITLNVYEEGDRSLVDDN